MAIVYKVHGYAAAISRHREPERAGRYVGCTDQQVGGPDQLTAERVLERG